MAALRVEPTTISPKPFRQAGIEIGIVLRLFNAGLAINDERDVAHPELAEGLPQVNSDGWRVFSDGRMEPTYRLKPGLVAGLWGVDQSGSGWAVHTWRFVKRSAISA